MKTIKLLSKTIVILFFTTFCSAQSTHPVYMGELMSSGYDLGLASSNDSINWLSDQKGFMKMEYPSGLSWGTVFITVGKIKDLPNKPTVDLTSFKKLSLELKGDVPDQKLEIGMKDNQDENNGMEAKVPLVISKEWQSYEIDLSEFKTTDLKNVYVLAEFVFNGNNAQTVYFRNIQFKK